MIVSGTEPSVVHTEGCYVQHRDLDQIVGEGGNGTRTECQARKL